MTKISGQFLISGEFWNIRNFRTTGTRETQWWPESTTSTTPTLWYRHGTYTSGVLCTANYNIVSPAVDTPSTGGGLNSSVFLLESMPSCDSVTTVADVVAFTSAGDTTAVDGCDDDKLVVVGGKCCATTTCSVYPRWIFASLIRCRSSNCFPAKKIRSRRASTLATAWTCRLTEAIVSVLRTVSRI